MSDILDKLYSELLKRREKNPKYSIRAFARDLQIDQSLLTKILGGKRKISRKLAHRLEEEFKTKRRN